MIETRIAESLGLLWLDGGLHGDLLSLCTLGGRLSGTQSERAAVDWLEKRLADASGQAVRRHPVAYAGWRSKRCTVERIGASRADLLQAQPLVGSHVTGARGATAEVVDLGRGTPEDFAAHAAALRGRIALVRHEYMFASGHVHRRRKMQMAMDHGAVGFLIGAHLPGIGPVAGSSGRAGGPGIPGAGISHESATLLADGARARIIIEAEEGAASADNLIAEIPGETDSWVVLSAHIDGHDLAASAMDNASGLAVVLAVTRALAPLVPHFRRGLRVALFNVEEWALTGSKAYVEGLSQADRDRIVLNVNLDSVAGSTKLSALTSGFAGVEAFLSQIAASCGMPIGLHRPLMVNSDHANFAAAGIPAFRLVAGFDQPGSNLRYVLTPADTADKIAATELKAAALFTAHAVARACTASDSRAASFRGTPADAARPPS
ncbi:MAG: M28 family peptidase [Alphaproteobacteria bacterium]|nr:M28 family peptidase [Alphaproteobacteria bacterium]